MKEYRRIELFGFPGCGKTTTMESLQKEWPIFQVQKANMPPSFRNIWALLVFAISRPRILLVFSYVRFVPRRYIKKYFETIIRFMIRIMVAEKQIKSGEKIIVDEGVLQISWSLLLLPTIYSNKFNVVEKTQYISKCFWPRTDLLIYHIIISDKEYIERINSRERKHFFSEAFIANNIKYIEKGKEVRETILDSVSTKYTIIEI